MESVTAISTPWTIAKTAGEVSNKLYEFAKTLKDREQKHEVYAILDSLTELKHSASKLEDENLELREVLRFKSKEESRTSLRYCKAHPEQPLCVKCFSENIEAQMSEPKDNGHSPSFHHCLSAERPSTWGGPLSANRPLLYRTTLIVA
jgi:hypothetical protein